MIQTITVASLIGPPVSSMLRPRWIVNVLILLFTVASIFPQASKALQKKVSANHEYKQRTRVAPSPGLKNYVKKRSKRSTASLPHRWYSFISPDRDFTLAFPKKPNREQDTPGPVTSIRLYTVTTENAMTFSINFQDVGGDPIARQSNEWTSDHEQIVAAAARQNGERVVQIHRLSKNIVEMELWETVPQTGANINYLRRDILWRSRVYSLGCGSLLNDRQVDKSICRKFFTSMRLSVGTTRH